MSRGTAFLLLSLATFLGCGGRTEELFDDQAAGGARAAGGGALGTGAANVAGFGASSGASSAAGASGSPFFDIAGSSGNGADAGYTAAAGKGGSPSTGGAPSVAGFTGIAGAPGVGGFPGVAGGSGAGPIIDACVAIAANSCEKCLCSACSSQVVSCFSNIGCALIFACVEKTGCKNLGCYTNATCRQVIDQSGGFTGSALGSVFALAACSATSQAACTCN
jgi:hypothetical protein